MIRFVIPSSTLLGQLPSTEIYVDLLHFKEAKEISGVKIFQYSCSLFFMNRDHFRESLYQKTLEVTSDDILELVLERSKSSNHHPAKKSINQELIGSIHSIIIDCSTISYIDISGVETISDIVNSLKELNIRCFLSSAPTQVLIMFERKKLLENLPKNFSGIFPSVHDAVVHASNTYTNPFMSIHESHTSFKGRRVIENLV